MTPSVRRRSRRRLDLDHDGMDEYVLYNNRVFAVFERWGGRLIHGFSFADSFDDALQVLGAPVVNPSQPGEEESAGASANRCSSFKDMHAAYVDAEYGVAIGSNSLTFTSLDGLVSKTITLPSAGGTLTADYINNTGGDLYVRVGASTERARPDLQRPRQPEHRRR